MKDYPENLYLHGFNSVPQLGPKRLLKIARYFKSFKIAFQSSQAELLASGLEGKIAEIFIRHRTKINLAEEEENLARHNIKLLSYQDPTYPKLLLEIPAFPPLLYYKGRHLASDELMLAVVGTRKISNYGRSVIPYLLNDLIHNGLVVVSGLAFGVDGAAHTECVKNNKRTVAVLGCGLDGASLYPKEHAYLAEQIIETGGTLVSEHPPGRPALKQNFVARNRIISGLAVGTLVIECELKSGALITARHALDQNRQVYAVPGQIYSLPSQGPNNLLKMGARCVTDSSDILSDLNINIQAQTLPVHAFNEQEKAILEVLGFQPTDISQLVQKLNMEISVLSATLTFLEMKGQIKNLGSQQYVLVRKI